MLILNETFQSIQYGASKIRYFDIYRNVDSVLPSIPWHPCVFFRVFHAGFERILQSIQYGDADVERKLCSDLCSLSESFRLVLFVYTWFIGIVSIFVRYPNMLYEVRVIAI